MATFFVMQGRDKGKRFDLRGPSLVLGRDAGTPLQVNDTEVSRRHAEIRKDEQGYLLVDLGSSNGSFVRLKDEHPVTAGDILLMGQQLFRVDA